MGVAVALLVACLVELVVSVYCLARVRGLVMSVRQIVKMDESILKMLESLGADVSVSAPSPLPSEVDAAQLEAATNLLKSLGLDVEKE